MTSSDPGGRRGQPSATVPPRPQHIDPEAWRDSLLSYLSIARVARTHEEQSLKPALARMKAALHEFDARHDPEGQRISSRAARRQLEGYQARLLESGMDERVLRAQRRDDPILRNFRTTTARSIRRERLRRRLFRTLDITKFETEANGLMVQSLQRVMVLAATPIPDFEAFALKIELLFDEIFQHDPDNGSLFAELVADARSLSGAQAAR